MSVRAGAVMTTDELAELRAQMAFERGKWDVQAGDGCALAPFALHLDAQAWAELAREAEALAAEALTAEMELLRRPELLAELALPRRVRAALVAGEGRGAGDAAAGVGAGAATRFARFDFHPTADGWRISEMNSDVPGGFVEASALGELALPRAGGAEPARSAGDPLGALAAAVAGAAAHASNGPVALVHATAYSDDRQAMVAVTRALGALGAEAVLAAPDHLRWSGGEARFCGPLRAGERVGAILRFYPGEWLGNLPGAVWRALATPARTPMSNPVSALLTQSKRFPLVWDRLQSPLPTWRCLLPPTHDPRRAPAGPPRVLKPALGRVGEGVLIPGVPCPEERKARKGLRRRPGRWVAQERFESVPIIAGAGMGAGAGAAAFHVCIGVFVIDGRAAGAYGRVSRTARIDQYAQDAAVRVDEPALASAQQPVPASVQGATR